MKNFRQYDPESKDLCLLLLQSGADPCLRDKKGRRAEDYALSGNNKECLSIIEKFKRQKLKKSYS